MNFFIRWLFNKKIREAFEYRKSILKLLHAHEDLIPAEEVIQIREKADILYRTLHENGSKEEIDSIRLQSHMVGPSLRVYQTLS